MKNNNSNKQNAIVYCTYENVLNSNVLNNNNKNKSESSRKHLPQVQYPRLSFGHLSVGEDRLQREALPKNNKNQYFKKYIKTGFIIYREGYIEGVGLEDDVRQYIPKEIPLTFYHDVDQVIHFSGGTLLEPHKSSKSLRIRL